MGPCSSQTLAESTLVQLTWFRSDPSQWWMIVDLSFPFGHSFNNGISSKLASVSYTLCWHLSHTHLNVGQLWRYFGFQHKRGVALKKIHTFNCSAHGVAESTLRFYAAGKKRYLTFCSQFICRPLPVTEATLLRFTALLASLDLSYQRSRLYLCAVLHLQIVNKLPDPSLASYPLLIYALRGFVEEAVE